MMLRNDTDVAEIIRKSEEAIGLIQSAGIETYEAFKVVEELWPVFADIPLATPEIKNARARLLFHLSFADSCKGLFDRAIDRALESLALFEELGVEKQCVATANVVGLAYLNKGEYWRAIEIFESNLKNAERIGNRTLICQIYKNIGRAHWFLGNTGEAIAYARQGLVLANTIPDRKVVITAYMNLGNMYASIDELVQALEYYLCGLELTEQYHADSPNTRAQFLMNIGGVFLRMGDFDRAPEYYLRSLDIQIGLNRPVELARLYGNIGELYKERREFATAQSYLLQSAAVYDRLQLYHEKAYIFAMLSEVALLMNEPESALDYGVQSRDLAQADNKRTLVLALHAIARVYIHREEYAGALEYLYTAREQYQALGSVAGELDVLADIADVCARQNRVEDAVAHLLAAHELAGGKTVSRTTLARIQHALAELCERTGDDKQALVYFKAARELEKAMFSEKSEFRVQTLRILHEVQEAQKEAEIHRLKNEQLERDMKHLRHDLVVHALHLAQRQDLLFKTKRELAAMNRGVLLHLHHEVRGAERSLDKVLLKTSSGQEIKKEALLKVRQQLAAIHSDLQHKVGGQVGAVLQNLDNALTDERLWEQFARQYSQVHIGFLEKLSAAFPRLSTTELKVCALIHINLSSKEIGRILNISSRSVDTYRYNIRQKMGIPSETNLAQYMAELVADRR